MQIKSQFKKICASMIDKGSLGAASTKGEGYNHRARAAADLSFTEACDPAKVFSEILNK